MTSQGSDRSHRLTQKGRCPQGPRGTGDRHMPESPGEEGKTVGSNEGWKPETAVSSWPCLCLGSTWRTGFLGEATRSWEKPVWVSHSPPGQWCCPYRDLGRQALRPLTLRLWGPAGFCEGGPGESRVPAPPPPAPARGASRYLCPGVLVGQDTQCPQLQRLVRGACGPSWSNRAPPRGAEPRSRVQAQGPVRPGFRLLTIHLQGLQ